MLVNVVLAAATAYVMRQLDEAATLLPKLPEVMRSATSTPSVIVSADGKVLETIQTEYREPVDIDKVPVKVIYAILAAEDKRFYDHGGVDPVGMFRAVFNTASGRRVEGGSTLTMQLAKQAFTSTDRTMERKVKDMALATLIERRLTKDQILNLYLNTVYFGSGAYGISAAAEVYFGKDLNDLSYAEAAMLARCVRRPSVENPFVDLKTSTRNRDVVLRTMLDEGWVSEEDYEKSLVEPVKLRRDKVAGLSGKKLAPYFVDYVRSYLRENLPSVDLSGGGYRVETTLHFGLQQQVDSVIRDQVNSLRRSRVTTGAFVVMDSEGRIKAMTGGPSYDRNQFNVVTQGRRQPGSAFKPFIYAAAFEYGTLSPYGSVSNEPFKIREGNGYRYIRGGGKGGSVSVRSAMMYSINVPAMWAIQGVGVRNAVHLAKSAFGFNSDLPAVPSVALGAGEVSLLEMASAYSVFQTGGDRVVPFCVVRVIGPDGLPVKKNEPTVIRRVISSDAARGMDSLLRAVAVSGTGRAAGRITNARGKTGTTSDNKDAWFCGYTDKFVGIGWVANEIPREGRSPRYGSMAEWVMGGDVVAPIWARVMDRVHAFYPEKKSELSSAVEQESRRQRDEEPGDEPPDEQRAATSEPGPPEDMRTVPLNDESTLVPNEPAKVVEPPAAPIKIDQETLSVEVCADSGQRATVYCPEKVRKEFKRGSEPKGRCPIHRG
ncbi:MAG: transglycosylase domain-containing protein [Fimbriimonadaceae bacterium]|nr:transglycosylase domain-containing protein [Fimbriimonadaceae bacterium]QYK55415.1 MAG: transglycosylase domain-containing protein [Fimbriimonadaceae bacterium]